MKFRILFPKVSKLKTSTSYHPLKLIQNCSVNKLSIYLGKISEEINLIAAKSYPRQSIKRREQGTIVATITLNKDGNLREIDFDKKKPKRLYKTTEKIFKKYIFPKPPENILNKQKLVKFKISVNFILQ